LYLMYVYRLQINWEIYKKKTLDVDYKLCKS
jgi:hypothetical protein